MRNPIIHKLFRYCFRIVQIQLHLVLKITAVSKNLTGHFSPGESTGSKNKVRCQKVADVITSVVWYTELDN